MSSYRRPADGAAESPFVVVDRLVDPTLAELASQVLSDHGIENRLLGTRDAALIGVAPHVLSLRIEVREDQLAEARELLAALRTAPKSNGAATDDDDDHGGEPPRKIVLAIGAAILVFGGSHLYARRPWTAAILASVQLSALLLARHDPPEGAIGGAAVFAIIAADAIFGARAAAAWNRGVRPSIGRQVGAGVLIASLVALVAGCAGFLASR